MTKGLLIGIDPGLTGAITAISEDKIVFHDMPVCDQEWSAWKKGKGGTPYRQKRVDGKKLWRILKDLKLLPHRITVEAVTPLPKYGASSAWKFAGGFYTVTTVCDLLGLNTHFITPATWKRQFNFTGKGKDAPRQAALKIYPHLDKELGFQYHQGRADALFIALSKC